MTLRNTAPRVSRVFLPLVLSLSAAWLAADARESAAQGLQPQSIETATAEIQIRRKVNAIRTQRGLPALQNNSRVAEVARAYSRQMATQKFFSHTSPTGQTFGDRLKRAGLSYRAAGENLYRSTNIVITRVPTTSTTWWMGSSGHRANILRTAFTQTGVGVWRSGNTIYVTQLFYTPL